MELKEEKEYFENYSTFSENGDYISGPFNENMTDKKITVNHYHIKSREEYEIKNNRGRADIGKSTYTAEHFLESDINEFFDDGIIKDTKFIADIRKKCAA